MDAFSYLAVLLSIVLGLGLTQLLTASGRLIRHRQRVRLHWLPLLWAALLLLMYVQAWWAMYGLRFRQRWTFAEFGVVLAQTATLYLMAAVALPEQVEGEQLDLGADFDAHHRWFFGFFLATVVISALKDVVLGGRLPDPVNLAFHVVLATIGVAGMTLRRRRAQEVLGIVGVLVIVTYIGVLFRNLR